MEPGSVLRPEDFLLNLLGLEDSKDRAFRLTAPKRQQRIWKLFKALDFHGLEKYCTEHAHDKDGLMLNLRGPNGWKPLHSLAMHDSVATADTNTIIQISKLFLRHGADINDRDNPTKESPLALASFYGKVSLVECLLSNGARLDLTDWRGFTPRQNVEWAISDCPHLADRRDCHDEILALLDHAAASFVTGDSEVAVNSTDREKANQLRESGNRHFKAGDFETAISEYTASLQAAEDQRGFNNRCQCYLNMAKRVRARDGTGCLKEARAWYRLAMADAIRATGLEPPSAKAFQRHATALIGIGDFPRALFNTEQALRRLAAAAPAGPAEDCGPLRALRDSLARGGVPDRFINRNSDEWEAVAARLPAEPVAPGHCFWCECLTPASAARSAACFNCNCPVEERIQPIVLRERYLGTCPSATEGVFRQRAELHLAPPPPPPPAPDPAAAAAAAAALAERRLQRAREMYFGLAPDGRRRREEGQGRAEGLARRWESVEIWDLAADPALFRQLLEDAAGRRQTGGTDRDAAAAAGRRGAA